jgi:hypothetical protein
MVRHCFPGGLESLSPLALENKVLVEWLQGLIRFSGIFP